MTGKYLFNRISWLVGFVPGSDGNKGVLHIPQNSNITEASPSDCLVSYPGHSLGGSYLFKEKQSVYSTAPADGPKNLLLTFINYYYSLPLCRVAVGVFNIVLQEDDLEISLWISRSPWMIERKLTSLMRTPNRKSLSKYLLRRNSHIILSSNRFDSWNLGGVLVV